MKDACSAAVLGDLKQEESWMAVLMTKKTCRPMWLEWQWKVGHPTDALWSRDDLSGPAIFATPGTTSYRGPDADHSSRYASASNEAGPRSDSHQAIAPRRPHMQERAKPELRGAR